MKTGILVQVITYQNENTIFYVCDNSTSNNVMGVLELSLFLWLARVVG